MTGGSKRASNYVSRVIKEALILAQLICPIPVNHAENLDLFLPDVAGNEVLPLHLELRGCSVFEVELVDFFDVILVFLCELSVDCSKSLYSVCEAGFFVVFFVLFCLTLWRKQRPW